MIDDQLSFTDHIATTARSCRFALYNIRKIRPFLSEQAAQLLVQLLFSPDWTIVMLSWRVFPHGLSSLCNWSRMQQPEWSLMSRKKLTLHLSSSGYTGYHSRSHQIQGTDVCLQDHNWHCTIYLNSLVQTYAPSRSLRSASERRLLVPSQRGTKSLSRTFTWTVPSWWNDLPISIRTAESLAIFKKHLKTHLFRQHLTN